MSENGTVTEFFDDYAQALLARDERAMARLYAVPSLILFPGQSVAVSSAAQTEEFFAAAWGQYEGMTSISKDVVVAAEAPHSVWADVTWHYGTDGGDRMLYQLIDTGGEWRIAVLTPLG